MAAEPPCMEVPSPTDQHLTVCVLASGSRGNAIFVKGGDGAILFDAGLSGVEIERRMASRGLDPKELTAIVVSHEHSDHVKGVGIMCRRYKLPVYMTPGTSTAADSQLGRIEDLRHFECGTPFTIGNLMVHPFSISHDAADPSGFTVTHAGIKLGIATDLGRVTAVVTEHLRACHALVLETNHDEKMLIEGPYPWPLKQRIRGRNGHLSNPDAGKLLTEVFHDDLRHIWLAHLSQENNTPDKAAEEIVPRIGGRTKLTVCCQETPTQVVCLMTDEYLPDAAD
jgi:phosphoribosyl 1,2-cyclic phosphodiesterase